MRFAHLSTGSSSEVRAVIGARGDLVIRIGDGDEQVLSTCTVPVEHVGGLHVMSLVRLLPAWLHAVADYAVGAVLIIVALAVGGSTGAVATGVVVGATVLAVSMLTKYPLGLVKVLPFTVHSAGDYLAAALLFAAPFALNFSSGDSGLTAFYVAAGAAVLAVSLVTNYQYSPKRAWSSAVASPA